MVSTQEQGKRASSNRGTGLGEGVRTRTGCGATQGRATEKSKRLEYQAENCFGGLNGAGDRLQVNVEGVGGLTGGLCKRRRSVWKGKRGARGKEPAIYETNGGGG